MADSATRSTRKRPARATARPASSANGTKPRAKAKYHVYSENGDSELTPMGIFMGRNATEAIEAYRDAGHDIEGITFVVVPDRNLARVTADVETKTKVKLRAA